VRKSIVQTLSTRAGSERDMATDRETFLSLLDRHGSKALGMLRRLCGNGHDAEDVFQDVAVRVWKHLGERPRLHDDRAWLMTIAYRAYLDHQARRPPLHVSLFDDDEPLARTGGDRDPVAVAERAEHARLLNEAVVALPPALREVVALHYSGGLSLRQVAAATGASIGTVKSRLNAALAQLRRRLP
jgi:RNA polymerase sigma-70 factor (ECF subfamily)